MAMRRSLAAGVVIGVLCGCSGAMADTLSFDAVADSTMYAESGTASNGAGEFIFVGRTGSGGVRRGLVKFDVGVIPAGSTITSATLTMHVSRTQVGPQLVSAHRVLQAWGEGSSSASGSESAGAAATANDATWTYRLSNTQAWDMPGGTVMSPASESVLVDQADTAYAWSGSGVTADVAEWVNNPSQNFGWEIIGPENARSSKRFNSRTHPAEQTRPRLTVTFTPSTPIGGCCYGSGVCSILKSIDCALSFGHYLGDSVYCESKPCPQQAVRPAERPPAVDAPPIAPVVTTDGEPAAQEPKVSGGAVDGSPDTEPAR